MRPARTPFALDYIAETLEAFRVARDHAVDAAELGWAADVLDAYFARHAGEPEAAEAHRMFQMTCQSNRKAGPEKMVPYARTMPANGLIGLESMLELATHRRSVRWFKSDPVPRDIIDQAVEVARQAPSACNRQPFHFRVFDDPQLVQQIVAIPYGTAGYAENVPVVVVVVGALGHFFSERDRHLIYIDSSLATMGFLYGLEAQGLSSCCINWPDVEDREARLGALINLRPDERPVMLVALGYADPSGLVASSAKKSVDLLRSYNFE